MQHITDEVLGKFIFDADLEIFESEIKVDDSIVAITIGGKDDIATMRELCANIKQLIADASAFAADELLKYTSNWGVIINKEEFISTISPNLYSLDVYGDRYKLWFDGDEIFTDHSITIEGNIKSGLTSAHI